MKESKSQNAFGDLKLWAKGLAVAALTVTCVVLVRGQGAPNGDAVLLAPKLDANKELSTKIMEPFTVAAVGDIIIRRPVAQLDDPGFQNLVKIMRSADITYANMEGPMIDAADPNYHGPNAGGPATEVNDLKAMGIRIMTTSNNHTMDAGPAGMFMTNHLLDEAGIVHSGSGKDLREAREAHIAITPKGAVGVIGMYSIDPASNPGPSRYSDARENWPGLNPMHVTPYNIVSADEIAALRKIRDDSYSHRSEVLVPVLPTPEGETPDTLFMFGDWYKVGDKTGAISYRMDPRDLAGIVTAIRNGKQDSDFLIVAIHCHQNSFAYQAYSHDNHVPDFLVQLAHTAIDNGADEFVAHGIHTLRGVEIYKNKPIFYGVSNFIYQEGASVYITDTKRKQPSVGEFGDLPHQPDDKEVLLTTSHYEGGKLVEVRIYPADLGMDGNRTLSKAGVPMTPSPETATKILTFLQQISEPFGTKIDIQNGVGVIRVSGQPAKGQEGN